jgi:uncharacterized protein YjbJ (UPF0337 family)
MNRDRLEGGIRHFRGRLKTATGAVSGDPARQVEGAFDQAAGAAQHTYGRAREGIHDLRRDGEHLYEEGRERARALADDARSLSEEARSRGEHFVHEARSRGEHLAHEARVRGEAFADEAFERGRYARDRALHHSRTIARRAEDNRLTTLAVVAAVAFGLGWLSRPSDRR